MRFVLAIVALAMLAGCQRPMTWNEMHGWMPVDKYRVLRALPYPRRIAAPVETRDC